MKATKHLLASFVAAVALLGGGSAFAFETFVGMYVSYSAADALDNATAIAFSNAQDAGYRRSECRFINGSTSIYGSSYKATAAVQCQKP